MPCRAAIWGLQPPQFGTAVEVGLKVIPWAYYDTTHPEGTQPESLVFEVSWYRQCNCAISIDGPC